MAGRYISPVPIGVDWGQDMVNQFLEEIRRRINTPPFYSLTTDPGTANVPNGTWSIWKNTTSGAVKLWLNDGGTMRSVTIT